MAVGFQLAKMAGSTGNASVVKVGKKNRFRRRTREQIERLMAIAKRTWISVNEVLKNGKWDKDKSD